MKSPLAYIVKTPVFLFSLFLLILPQSLTGQAWTQMGVGGGGSLYAPSISPVNPNLVLEGSDMSGVYRSQDGGTTWQMVDFMQMTSYIKFSSREWMCPFAWHPVNANTVFGFGTKAGAGARLLKSTDAGVTWNPALAGPSDPWFAVTQICIDRINPNFMLAGHITGVYVSTDGGSTWTSGQGPNAYCVGIVVDETSPVGNRTCYLGTMTAGAYKSVNNGLNWSAMNTGLGSMNLSSLAGGSLTSTGKVVVYAAANGVVDKSINGGNWSATTSDGITTNNFLAVTDNNPDTVYVTPSDSYDHIYKSTNDGGAWNKVFNPALSGGNVTLGWTNYDGGFELAGMGQAYFQPLAIGVNPVNPDQVIFTNGMESYGSTDGGNTWQQDFTNEMDTPPPQAGQRWTSRGLEMTGAWYYQINPSNTNLHYICFTDIAYARSTDAGATWYCETKPNLVNTIYQLAFDPAQPNVVYAAISGQHDIPHKPFDASLSGSWGYGGVWKSTDQGATWANSSNGLPSGPNPGEPYPAPSIIADTSTNPATLYVSMWGGGVYKSTNSGGSWAATTAFSIGANTHTYFLKLHQDGTLFCMLGPRNNNTASPYPDPGGLFKSTNGGGTWNNITTKIDTANGGIPLYSPMQFDVDPNNSQIIYIAATDGLWDPAPGHYFPPREASTKPSMGAPTGQN